MEKLITGSLAESLSRNRERFNSLFARAVQRNAGLDPDDFGQFVRGPLQTIVDGVDALFPERSVLVAEKLIEICLTLFSQGQLGSQSRVPLLPALWQHLLPILPTLVAKNPRQVVGALSNAALNIGLEEPAAGTRWLKRLHSMAPLFQTLEQLLDASLVLAWRAGLPHYRESALEHWRKLPDGLKSVSMGIDPGEPAPSPAAFESALANPWHPPHLAGRETGLKLGVVGKVGRFRGLGGEFAEPPLVAASGDTIIAYDGEGSWNLWADYFGITLRRVPQGVDNSNNRQQGGLSIDKAGTISSGSLRLPFPPLAGWSSFASTSTTLAVTLPHSHAVYVVAPLVVEQQR